jgi:hypothetical protein
MKKDYESIQRRIDKLLLETSKMKTGKTYHDMYKSEDYRSAIKKIGKLVMELDIINKTDHEKEKRKRIYNN